MEQVRFRRLPFWEWVLRDTISKAVDFGMGVLVIKLYAYLGWLAYAGIPDLSWRQILIVALLLALWPKNSTSKYDEVD